MIISKYFTNILKNITKTFFINKLKNFKYLFNFKILFSFNNQHYYINNISKKIFKYKKFSQALILITF